jgi:SNF2 family DNA or RNA helicase
MSDIVVAVVENHENNIIITSNNGNNGNGCVSSTSHDGIALFDMYIQKSGMDKKDYQREGVEWLIENETRCDSPCGVKGGFVADEMGLGKTIMMIGICISNFVMRTLIVVPPVLIDQWYNQIYKTTGHKSIVYRGKNKKTIISSDLDRSVIVLCSYDAISIKNNSKTGNAKEGNIPKTILHDIKWGRVIFDEAHHLRNKKTSRYLGAKMLQSEIKWLVSGTPVQNKKTDFYALCSLINLPVSYYKDANNLSDIGRLFILKRSKKQVGIELDEVVVNKQCVSWKNKAEEKLAEEIHSAFSFSNIKSLLKGDFDDDVIDRGDCTDRGGGFMDVMMDHGYGKLPLLLRARQSCVYPKMMSNKIEIFHKLGLIKNNNMDFYNEAMKNSSKLDSVVAAILERKDNHCGKLVFCHFKEEMNELASRLRNFGGMNVGILDGNTKISARINMINQAKDVLILQIQTGCEGLNLQENYSEIYFVSPHWNPFIEDQAIARCHRIGQMKPVFVWRFEMDNFGDNGEGGQCDSKKATKNLDEYVMDVQNGKRVVVSEIIV